MKITVEYVIGGKSDGVTLNKVKYYEINHITGFTDIEYHSGNTTHIKTDNIVLFSVEQEQEQE